ncbi:MAG TPA: ABC transporter permease, partial [Waddliaceae bacterium]
YLSRVATLNFGTLRNDSNQTVLKEVVKRIKYSLTLAVVPLLVTFVLCQIFGMLMATRQNQWVDHSLNIIFLILFAAPVFVVAPFLIEKIALNHTLPFTQIPIPYSGFHSPLEVYENYTSSQRVGDVLLHIFLPLIAIKYGTLAVQARLARTAFLEVLRQDYIRTARAKGLSTFTILVKHVGRNGAITIVTSLAASLGIVLGGSLIVETIFEINGFGRFFYQAILNRDYNVVLFSAFAGSFLTLIGYLIADIAYTFLDPRITLEG